MTALAHAAVRLGVMPLTDAAPLVVADALGLFAEEGLSVVLSVERSWAALRDKLAAGRYDAAALLAPMPLAAHLGLSPTHEPLLALANLNQGGSGLCVRTGLYEQLLQANPSAAQNPSPDAWGTALRRLHADGLGTPLTFAHPYPYSTHHYELRYWLAAQGFAPDRDVNIVTVPPPLVAEQLASGRIDAAWVGSPWPRLAEDAGVAKRLFDKQTFWPQGPEKVLACTQWWAAAEPQALRALLRAVLRAMAWLADGANLPQAALWLHHTVLPQASAEVLADELRQLSFAPADVAYPHPAQAQWLLGQMQRWNHLRSPANGVEALQCWRGDVFSPIAKELGIAVADGDAAALRAMPHPIVGN